MSTYNSYNYAFIRAIGLSNNRHSEFLKVREWDFGNEKDPFMHHLKKIAQFIIKVVIFYLS